MKKLFLFTISIALLVGCQENEINETETSEAQMEEVVSEELEDTAPNTAIEDEVEEQIKSEIDFGDYTLVIYGYESYASDNSLTNDSIEIMEEIGSNFENLLIEIIPNNPSDTFELFLARESKILASLGEKTTKTLTKWGRISGFEQLIDSALYFSVGESTREEIRASLEPSFEEIKQDVLQFEGEYINESLEQAGSINELPISVWISSTLIKIIRINSGVQEEKILVSRGSWGC